ncbi:putative transketolase N-terminal section [Desulfamplus magnetovallimortis]|uniref:Putative transketolase N-terminal section n=2 Tax=Desulfamplus magnetovallimortis TaxID=1246637 RepID=A0A1W1HEY6_9BACT|nr:putative transketolase N-terminal section [Desulfamplus magnetovallimortis]
MQYRSNEPNWDDRDRFILSKGHGCLALYVMLEEKGFISPKDLKKFCAFDGILGGHPERSKIPGVEASTGSLGHGLSIGIGMALRARMDQKGYRVFVVAGDGECNEGSIWEAALCASKHRLDNLTLIIDYNHMQSYGLTEQIFPLEPLSEKLKAFNFSVKEIDGHDVNALKEKLSSLPFSLHKKPSALICHTVKGKGISGVEHNLKWHHSNKVDSELAQKLIQGIL